MDQDVNWTPGTANRYSGTGSVEISSDAPQSGADGRGRQQLRRASEAVDDALESPGEVHESARGVPAVVLSAGAYLGEEDGNGLQRRRSAV